MRPAQSVDICFWTSEFLSLSPFCSASNNRKFTLRLSCICVTTFPLLVLSLLCMRPLVMHAITHIAHIWGVENGIFLSSFHLASIALICRIQPAVGKRKRDEISEEEKKWVESCHRWHRTHREQQLQTSAPCLGHSGTLLECSIEMTNETLKRNRHRQRCQNPQQSSGRT